MKMLTLYAAGLVFLTACAPQPRTDAAGVKAHPIRIRHPGLPAVASRARTLEQLNDSQGFPTAYRMTVESVICPERTCRIISVIMTWDALGRYLRYDLPAGEKLEKGIPSGRGTAARWTSAPFSEADCQKLDSILRDDHSLLASQQLAGMAKLQGKGEVDAITGATPDSARGAVVEGAALTCYNLWHWAHGEAAAAARELTRLQCSEALLLHFLASGQPHYAIFALEQLRQQKRSSEAALEAAAAAMVNGDRGLLEAGLDYLREASQERTRYAARVACVLNACSAAGRARLLDCLGREAAWPPAFFDSAAATLPTWSGYYEIHLFLRLAEREAYASPVLTAQTSKLLDNPDFFIARRAYAFLNSLPTVDALTAARLQVCRARAEREGRSL
jgi:hypothetical protein